MLQIFTLSTIEVLFLKGGGSIHKPFKISAKLLKLVPITPTLISIEAVATMPLENLTLQLETTAWLWN
jgi:hypothetical protein